jgi:3-oxoacyl-[acyl-carrier-protein] synthase II
MKRVVVTGVGAVTPLGNSIGSTWDNLTKKISGITGISAFDPAGLQSRIAGELKGFSPEDFIPKKDILRLDPFIHYAAASSLMAIEDAGLKTDELKKLCCGVIIGSSRGGIVNIEKALEDHLIKDKPFSAFLMSSTTINMASSYVSMLLDTNGPAIGISTACASGTNAIGEAARMIRHGEIDFALAGGSEAPLCKLAVGGYGSSGALSRRNSDPEKASRPFDMDRDGFIIAEGAGILALEELTHALKRGARIYSEVTGYGTSSDAFHQTRPDSKGEAEAIERALTDAQVSSDEIDYINAHATSTRIGDTAEANAIRRIFGSRTHDIHVSSCKSMLGHMLGAAGAVEAAITAISINKGIITPTINLENPDPDCDLHYVTATLNKEVNIALSNSFGFGGVNAVLVLSGFKE